MAASNQPQSPRIDELASRIKRLEEQSAEKDRRIEQLEATVSELEQDKEDLQERLNELEEDRDLTRNKISRNRKRVSDTKDRISEIQSRELEKGAHLRKDNVDTVRLNVDGGRVEQFSGDNDNQYVRLPGEVDPLERSGTSKLAQGDLLPIQQLSRLDDDMLRSTAESIPPRLAAKVWSEREQAGIEPWSKGSGGVRHYLDSSDLRHWIRREEDGVSKEYAKKLAQRVLDAIEELAKNRVYSQKKSRRKDGLKYKERRLILPADADIPGEGSSD